MKRIALIVGMLAGLLAGCGGDAPAADQCLVPPGWTIGYQDCGVPGCVATCGVGEGRDDYADGDFSLGAAH